MNNNNTTQNVAYSSKNFNINNIPLKPFAVFDMDGTLLGSMKYWNDLTEEYLISKNLTENIKELIKEFESMTLSESAEVIVKRFNLAISPKEAVDEMLGLMEIHYLTDIPLKSHVKELLEFFKTHGTKMCVASATEKYLIEKCLKKLGVLQYFDFVLSCEDYHTNKTVPDIYDEAARLFNASKEDVVIFEDALYAIQTAKSAGYYVVGVYDENQVSNANQICQLADIIVDLD